jgi:hypothetical protein
VCFCFFVSLFCFFVCLLLCCSTSVFCFQMISIFLFLCLLVSSKSTLNKP